jgi:phage-related holin
VLSDLGLATAVILALIVVPHLLDQSVLASGTVEETIATFATNDDLIVIAFNVGCDSN